MDGSLASILMSFPPSQGPHGSDGVHNQWSALDSICPDELRYQLMCASMELQRARAAAEEDDKIHEAKLGHLQELLAIIKRERDEALNECEKLRERLSQQTSSSADSPCSFFNPYPVASSPTSSPWSLQELEQHLNGDSFGDVPKISPVSELQQTLQTFSQSWNDESGFQGLFSAEPACDIMLENPEPAFSLDILEDGPSFDTDSNMNIANLEKPKEVMQFVPAAVHSTRSLSRQSSANSSSASVQMLYSQASIDLTDVMAPGSSIIGEEVVEVGESKSFSPNASPPGKAVKPGVNLGAALSHSVSSQDRESAAVLKDLTSQVQAYNAHSTSNLPLLGKQAKAAVVRQLHLPEPPEADPKVMLSSLPEKGKLLQAVMQAGPLLQTLLLAGPLPQWRHPPPALSTGEIPKVSMLPSNNLIFPHPCPVAVQGPIQYNAPVIDRAAASLPSKSCAPNMDLCSRPKKLRKLSPASQHQSQVMHMWSEDGRLTPGGISYPPTIY